MPTDALMEIKMQPHTSSEDAGLSLKLKVAGIRVVGSLVRHVL